MHHSKGQYTTRKLYNKNITFWGGQYITSNKHLKKEKYVRRN